MNACQTNNREGHLLPTDGAGRLAASFALETAVRRASARLARNALGGQSEPQNLQSLEPRRLMSASTTSFFDGTTFSLEGNNVAGNQMSIQLDADATHLRAVVNGDAGQWVAMQHVRRVRVSGTEGTDVIDIDSRLHRTGAEMAFASVEKIRIATVLDSRNGGGRTQLAEVRQIRGNLMKISSAQIETLAPANPMSIDVIEGQTGAFVESVTLVDADTDEPIDWVSDPADGMVLDLAKLSNGRLNLVAHVADAGANFSGSIYFTLDDWSHTENLAPYAVFGDENGDLNGWLATPGTHTLTATVYSEQNRGGVIGSTMKMTFTVVESKKVQPPQKEAEEPQEPVVDPGVDERPDDGGFDGSDDTSGGTSLQAKVNALQTRIVAGQSLHVSALATVLNNGGWDDASFEWNFGDSGSEFNSLRGFVASHLYETAGTYTVSLRVTDQAGKVDVERLTVTVMPSQRRQIFVDARGNDANDGSAGKPVRTAARAMNLLNERGAHAEILFRSGQDHSINATMYVERDDVVIGAYGSGAKPRLIWAGGLSRKVGMIQSAGHQRGLTVRDLAFHAPGPDGTNKDNRPFAFNPLGQGVAFVGNTLYDMGGGLNLNGEPTGVLVLNNDAPTETGIREYFIWGQGEQLTILGNYAINSTREHIIRLGGVTGVTMSGNTFDNLDRRSEGDPYDYAKGAISMQKGSFAYVTDNEFLGPTAIGPLGDGDGLKTADDRWTWAIWENNRFPSEGLQIDHGAEHVSIRYNLFESDDTTMIRLEGFSSSYGRGVVDVQIHGNVGVNNGSTGQFLVAHSGVAGLTITDNTYVAPNLEVGAHHSGAVIIKAADTRGLLLVDGNSWPLNTRGGWFGYTMNYLGTGYTNTEYRTNDEWNAISGVGTDQFSNDPGLDVRAAVLNRSGVPMAFAA